MTETSESAAPAAVAIKRRRRLWILIGSCVFLFASAFAVLVYSDAPEPDVSDLAPRHIELADEDNFYVQLT